MPDRYGTPDDERPDEPPTAAQAAAELARAAHDRELAERHAELELAARARANCDLCDADGYRRPERTTVCDHVDHAAAARRGIAACRAALTKEHTR